MSVNNNASLRMNENTTKVETYVAWAFRLRKLWMCLGEFALQ